MHAFILPLLLSGFLATGSPAVEHGVKSGLLTRTVTVGGESYTYQVFVPASLVSDDRVAPVTESRGMVEALKRVEGSRVRYSEYEGVGHNVWLNVAAEPGLLPWLLAQRAD